MVDSRRHGFIGTSFTKPYEGKDLLLASFFDPTLPQNSPSSVCGVSPADRLRALLYGSFPDWMLQYTILAVAKDVCPYTIVWLVRCAVIGSVDSGRTHCRPRHLLRDDSKCAQGELLHTVACSRV